MSVVVDLAVIALLFGVDQALKQWATAALQPVGSRQFIPGLLELYYLRNQGAAFSLLEGKQLLLILITGAAMLAAAWYLFTRCRTPQKRWERLSILLILAGGLGNFVDRLFHGEVVDYLNFLFISFPVFNFADICICVGVGLLVLCILLTDDPDSSAAKKEQPRREEH